MDLQSGIDNNGRKTQLQVPKNGASYGVKFKVEATTFNSQLKLPSLKWRTEEATQVNMLSFFTTNGQGWEHLAEWKRSAKRYEPKLMRL